MADLAGVPARPRATCMPHSSAMTRSRASSSGHPWAGDGDPHAGEVAPG
jgi:hypothetical protein